MSAMQVRTHAWHALLLDCLTAVEVRQAVVHGQKMALVSEMAAAGAITVAAGSGVPEALVKALDLAGQGDDDDDADYLRRDEVECLVGTFVTETAFCRIVDSFLTYLRQTLHDIALVQPQILKSSETVTYAQVLKMPSADDLVARLAETKVEKLSREGYQSLVAFLKRHLGADLFNDGEEERRLGYFVDVRNLHVHHRGQVHRRFAMMWGQEERLGQRLDIDWAMFIAAMRDLRCVATAIDRVAVEKFGVPAGGAGDLVNGE